MLLIFAVRFLTTQRARRHICRPCMNKKFIEMASGQTEVHTAGIWNKGKNELDLTTLK